MESRSSAHDDVHSRVGEEGDRLQGLRRLEPLCREGASAREEYAASLNSLLFIASCVLRNTKAREGGR